MNTYFDSKSIAARYEKGRPYFHLETMMTIKNYLGLHTKFDRALDVACGTGLSTKALLELANQIDATDISAEMLLNAYQNDRISYTKSAAEQLSFDPETFDIITVASGIHWFEIDKFLMEAHRVLKPGKCLIIYDSFFDGKMLDNEAFDDWYPQIYNVKFPPPKRNDSYNWSNENLRTKNFEMLTEQKCNYHIEFTLDQLVLYLTTQSNITAQVEQGFTSYEAAEIWLYQQLEPFFIAKRSTFQFGGWIKYLKKVK
jgi:ubiquinone/menaquinone biosynthesis C-methylase UbiE